jgi:hypothetical protein
MDSSKERIRRLNDQLRQHHLGGRVVITAGIQALGAAMIRQIDEAVTSFSAFGEANDPYGEHDFGAVEVQGRVILFKIDYYDLDLQHLSPDPADPAVTQRVLTLMLADEY